MGKRTERRREESIRWNGKPILAFFLRAVIFALPIAASIVASIWLSRVLPEPQNLMELVRWWAIVLTGSTVTLFVVTYGARKFLPLAALMKLTMVFPDKAPRRYKTALRSGSSVKHLKEELARAEETHADDDPSRAAAKILELSNALNSHDRLTRGHAERVRAYTEMLADEMGLPDDDRAKLRWAALLHDIGKLKISSDILTKPGRLDDAEWVEIKKHPAYGAEICKPLLDWLGPFATTIIDHHERFDGNGYPAGKKAEEISLGGRIVNVADAFDVMTTVRSYKEAMPATAAREELARHAGAQFDPVVVRAFLNVSMGRLRWVAGPLSWLAQLPFLRFVGAINQVGTAVGVAGVAATGVAAVVGAGVVDLPGDNYLELIPTGGVQAAAPAFAAKDDLASIDEDTAVTIAVLANDGAVDPNGIVSIVTDPEFGTVIVNEDGTVTYIPDPGYVGGDEFEYAITPPGDRATVVVTVLPTDDAPTAVDDRAEVSEDASVLIDVLANDEDDEGLDPGSVTVTRAPLNGTATVDAATGAIRYTPAADFEGTDGFRYRVRDTAGTAAEATVTVEVVGVNDPPVAEDDAATLDEDTSAAIDVLANDTDVEAALDPDTLTVVTSPSSGAAAVSGGAIVYTADIDFSGADAFTYEICDEAGECDTADVALTVTPLNDDPVAPGPGDQVTEEDTPISFDLLEGAADADGDSLTITITSPTTFGTLVASGSAYTYTPDLDYHGLDGFTFSVDDGNGGLDFGGVGITVTPVNDVPVVPGPGPLTVAEDTTVSFDPLANASDVDGDTVTLDFFDAVSAAGGTITSGSLIYSPPADFSGADTFSYVATDGVGGFVTVVVALDVTPVADNPVAADDGYLATEDIVLAVAGPGVLGNDTDPDGDPLTATVATPPALGTLSLAADGSFTYTPGSEFSGVDSFTYAAGDGTGGWDTASVSIEVAPINDTPVAADDAAATVEDSAGVVVDLLGNDTDVEDGVPDPGTLVLSSPDDGTVVDNGDGTVTYTPDPDRFGVDVFTYTVDDSAGATSNLATVTVTVASVNDAPVAGDDAASTAEDTAVLIDLVGNDSDVEDGTPDGGAIVLTAPADGAVVDNGDGTVTYTPDPNWNGVDAFGYTVGDSAGLTSNVATVTVTVGAVNDLPVAVDDSGAAYTTSEDTPFTTGDVTGNDGDVEDGVPDATTVTVVTPPLFGGLVNNGDGTFDYTPNPNYAGDDAFTYTVDDSDGGTSNIALVSVFISLVNDVPVANDDAGAAYDTSEDNPFTTPNVVGNDTDVEDGTPVATTVAVVTGPTNGGLLDNGDGTFDYSPAPNSFGVDSFTYRVDDSAGATSNVATVTINVAPVNDAPIANADGGLAFDTAEDVQFTTGDVTANDADVEDGTPDPTTVTIVALPSNGALTNNGDGTFDYKPIANWSGVDVFSYEVDDSAGATSNFADVQIVVAAVNDAPDASDDFGPAFDTNEDTPFTTPDVTGNDTDVEDGTPDATTLVVAGPTPAGLTNNGDGTFDYAPPLNSNGAVTFTYTVDDSAGATSNAATVTIQVAAVNDTPVANNDSGLAYNTAEDVTFTTGDVTANDTDVEDGTPDPATVTIVALPSSGSLTNNGDGTFDYKPNLDWSGVDSFTYDVDDFGGATSNTATVTIVVAGLNDVPVANDDSGAAFDTNEDTAFTTPNVVVNDTDVEDGTPDATTVNVVATTANGTLVNNGDGTFGYTPDANWNGVDSFTYEVDDSAGATSNVATVTINVASVNDLPNANDDGYSTDKGVPIAVAAPGVITNDVDEDGDPLVASLVSGPTSGGATVLVLNADGSFSYAPDPIFVGVNEFTYQVFDGTVLSNVATVSITVDSGISGATWYLGSGVHSADTSFFSTVAPPAVPLPDYDLDLASGRTIVSSGGSLGESDPTKYHQWAYLPATNLELLGPAQLDLWSALAGTPGDPAHPHWHLEDCTAAGTGCTTLLSGDQHVGDWDGGSGTWDNRIIDLGHLDATIAAGRMLRLKLLFGHEDMWVAYNTVAFPSLIRFTQANRPPVVFDDSASVNEDASVAIPVTGNDIDSNLDPDTISITVLPSDGSAVPRTDGSGIVDYTPTGDWSGADSFEYIVCDTSAACTAAADAAIVSVTVNPLNDPPVANDDGGATYDTNEETPFTTPDVTGNDTDVEDGSPDDTTVTVVGPVPPGLTNNGDGKFDYAPPLNFSGTVTFDYTVDDSVGATSAAAAVTINVAAVNDPPALAAIPDPSLAVAMVAYSQVISATDVDTPAASLSFTIVGLPAWAAWVDNLDGTATISGTPGVADLGTTSVTATVSDGSLPDSQVFDLSVTAVPLSGFAGEVVINEVLYQQRAGINEEFVELYNASASPVVLTGWHLASHNIPLSDPVDFDFVFPATDDLARPSTLLPGEYAVIWLQTRGGTEIAPDAALEFSGGYGWILDNDGEDVWLYDAAVEVVDYMDYGDRLSALADFGTAPPPALGLWDDSYSIANQLAVALGTGTSLSLTPNGGNPNHSACWEATTSGDATGRAECAGAPLTIDTDATLREATPGRNNNNIPPVANDDGGVGYTTPEDGGLFVTADVTANDTDVEDAPDPTTVAVVIDVSNGTLANNGDGTFDYTPNLHFAGTDTFTYRVDDAMGGTSASATVTIAVTQANDPPVLDPVGNNSVDEEALLTFTATGSDPLDSPANGLTFTLSGEPAGASITAAGAFSWTPTEAQGGSDYVFDVVITDDGTPNLADSESITITVNEVNKAPVVTDPGNQSDPVSVALSLFVAAADPDTPANNFTFSDGGTLPTGLAINAATGEVTGTPTAPGSYSVTITATETDGVPANLSGDASFTWTIASASLPKIVVSEFSSNGAGEFIELYNADSVAVDIENFEAKLNGSGLSDITITQGGGPIMLPVGGHYLLVSAGGSYDGLADQTFAFSLTNDIGIRVRDDAGNVLDEVGQGAASWFETSPLIKPGAAAIEQSFERLNTLLSGNCRDTDDNPSDFVHNYGFADPQNMSMANIGCGSPPAVGHVVISEFRPRGPGGARDEFVELFNPTSAPADISGWKVHITEPGLFLDYHIVPAATVLGPGEYYLLSNTNGPMPADASPFGFGLNYAPNWGDIVLKNSADVIIDVLGYGHPSWGQLYEANPLPNYFASTANRSYARRLGGCQDVDNNLVDFIASFVATPSKTGTFATC